MLRIDAAIAELFAGLRRLLRDIVVLLGAERRLLRRLEFERLLDYGRINNLGADELAEYARGIGDKRSARALRRLARIVERKALPAPHADTDDASD